MLQRWPTCEDVVGFPRSGRPSSSWLHNGPVVQNRSGTSVPTCSRKDKKCRTGRKERKREHQEQEVRQRRRRRRQERRKRKRGPRLDQMVISWRNYSPWENTLQRRFFFLYRRTDYSPWKCTHQGKGKLWEGGSGKEGTPIPIFTYTLPWYLGKE